MERTLIDLSTVIGIFALCNTAAVLIHEIDYGENRVLASINGIEPEWCEITEQKYVEEEEPGFYLGSLFVPFAEVMRFYGGGD